MSSETWPEVVVVKSRSGETPGLPAAYLDTAPPSSYCQHPEIWQVEPYVPEARLTQLEDGLRGEVERLQLEDAKCMKLGYGFVAATYGECAEHLQALLDNQEAPGHKSGEG